MEWYVWLMIVFGLLLGFMATGLPVAFSFIIVNVIGAVFLWGGDAGLSQLPLSMYASIKTFTLIPLPLFILMGEVMFQSKIGTRMVETIDKWMGKVPGRLSLAGVAGGAVLGSLTGASMASIAILGTSLLPEMEKRGYKKSMSIGPILGSGGVAILIPPSAMAVLYASIAQLSPGKVLIAIIGPGILVSVLYAAYIVIRCKLQPSLAPSYEIAHIPVKEKLIDTVKYILPLGFIVFAVTGVMILGIASATEASALGAVATIILAFVYEGIKWKMIKRAILNTIQVTAMIFLIILGGRSFSQILTFTGAVTAMTKFVQGLTIAPPLIVGSMMVIVLIMGSFMESASIMMITAPIFMGIIDLLGYDPVWFAALMILNIEIGLSSPPFGTNLFVMKGLAPPDTTMEDVYLAGLPFIALDILGILLIIIFPAIAMYLPNLMVQ
jgi:tripartite ATP-independent transporter DctM subunit